MLRTFLIIFPLLLSACAVNPLPATSPTDRVMRLPSVTPNPSATPSPTPTQITPTVPSTPDPRFFRDDFTHVLDAQWSWVREDPLNWSLEEMPGALKINVESGSLPRHSNSNLLLRPAPQGDLLIETQVAIRPRENFQFAGLVIYESDSNFIQAGRAYCRTSACVGEGLYMHSYQNGRLVEPDFGQRYQDSDPVGLRLSRRGNIYTFEASTDGKVWFLVGSHTSEMEPLQIGLMTGEKLSGEAVPAVFDYFEVRSLP
jgi:beta-xylosidase